MAIHRSKGKMINRGMAFSKDEIDKWLSVIAAARLVENITEEKRRLLAIIKRSET
jgi:hypothetical protein